METGLANNLPLLIPLVAFITYCGLLVFAWTSPRSQLSKLFIYYLLMMMVWSLSSFLMRTTLAPGPLIWNRIMVMCTCGVPFVFFHFTQKLLDHKANPYIRIGYLLSVLLIIANWRGLIVPSATLTRGYFDYSLGPVAPLLGVFGGGYTFVAGLLLCRECLRGAQPFWSNRFSYPALGAMFVVVGSMLNFIPQIGKYPVDIAANTVNAFLLANAIYCHRLLNATIPIRKALVFFITLIGMTVSYHLLLFLIDAFSYGAYSFAAAALIIALFTLLCYERLRNGLQTWLDRTLFGEQYNYRETLKDYSRLMTSILDLDELASSTLLLLVKALHVNGVILFLPDEEGHFYAHDQLGYSREVLAMRVDKLSVIVRWLSRQNEAILSWQEIENLPEFRGLWQREKDHLQQLGAELLVGINFQNNLQGILLLADKKSKSPYTDDDKALLVTLTNQAAVVLQNAQIYREVRSQAVRDDLTKLYNFRYLQEFLDNEISRCAKSGLCFSVILLDLDFFKTYNDVYGHLAGDDALIKIAQALTESIRVSDVAARYGGDEFAVILPETDLEEAKEIAEKIKERVCLNFQSSGSSLLTTSLGVAAYPEHGQTKQQLIASADRALYKAKNFGRNHITLGTSAEIAVASGVSETASQAEKDFLKEQVKGMQLDTIYTLAAAIYARDNYTYQHSKMVTQYAVALAEALGLSYEHKQIINNAAMLHDIGKIGIPENVLNKPGPLTASEREMINYHVTIGEAILNQMPYLRGLAAIIRHHHEQYDGNGYPDRLKKENIPLEARILAIADAFHAMTSDRPYRKARSKEDALREMTALAGSQFDPHLVPVFVKMIKTQNL